MYCMNCGSEINNESKFCPSCGVKIQKMSGPICLVKPIQETSARLPMEKEIEKMQSELVHVDEDIEKSKKQIIKYLIIIVLCMLAAASSQPFTSVADGSVGFNMMLVEMVMGALCSFFIFGIKPFMELVIAFFRGTTVYYESRSTAVVLIKMFIKLMFLYVLGFLAVRSQFIKKRELKGKKKFLETKLEFLKRHQRISMPVQL